MLAAFAGDEPVFAIDSVQHIGQVIGLVVADSVMQARRAVRRALHEDDADALAAARRGVDAAKHALGEECRLPEEPEWDEDEARERRQFELAGDLPAGGVNDRMLRAFYRINGLFCLL